MAAVRLEDSVWKSWRFRLLGTKCGQNRSWAIGKMAEIYSECTDRNSDVLCEKIIDALGLEDGVADLSSIICIADLGEGAEGGIRVRGRFNNETGYDRLGWLEYKRKAGSKGGQQTSSKRVAQDQHESSKRVANGYPPTPTPVPSPITSDQKLLSEGLESAYQRYPRKEGKAKGMIILARDIKSPEDLRSFGMAVDNYAKQKLGTERQFIKLFSTFAGCWTDYIEIESSTPSPYKPIPKPVDIPEADKLTLEEWSAFSNGIPKSGFTNIAPKAQA